MTKSSNLGVRKKNTRVRWCMKIGHPTQVKSISLIPYGVGLFI